MCRCIAVVALTAVFLAFFDGYEYDMGTGIVAADPAELRRRALLMASALFRPRTM